MNLRSKILEIKTKNEKLLEQNNELTIKLFEFKNKVNELNLYIKKIKDDFETKNSKMKEKIGKIIDIYEEKIAKLNEKIELYKPRNNKSNNNINIIKEKNNNKNLKIENEISFNIFNKNNKNKINIKPNKINQRKNFNFSLNQSIESNQFQNSNNSTNKPTLKDGTIKKYTTSSNSTEMNDKNYIQKKIENEKLKEEISRLKQEITELVQDINKQQKLISESNFQTKNTHDNCDKCDSINNLIIKSNLPDTNKLSQIKATIMNSSFLNNNIKNAVNTIFDIIIKLLNHMYYNSIDINNNNLNQKTYMMDNNKDNNNCFNKKIIFSEINGKLFSSSELKKYHLIYSKNVKNINELIKIYEKRTNNIKNNLNNIKLNLDSTISEQNDISFGNKKNIVDDRNIENTVYDYKNVKDEILKLKQEKIIFDNTIELVKNYLIMNEKIFNFFFGKKHNKKN